MANLLAVVAVFFSAVAFRVLGVTIALTGIVVLGLFMLPRSNLLGSLGLSVPIATAAMVLVGVIAVFGRKGKTFPLAFLPLIIYLFILMIFGWTNVDASTWNSFLTYVIAALAFGAGLYIAARHQENPRFDRWFVLLLLAAALFQTAVAALQTVGVDLFPSQETTTDFTEGRASGSFGHPGNLGKAILFLIVLVLPLTKSADTAARRLSFVTLGVALLPVALSVSRTNFVVVGMVLVLWALLLPRSSKIGGRVALVGAVGVVGFLFADQFIGRLTADPAGGARERLSAVALEHIPDNLLLGVGPGGYIPYFGQFDSLTGSGWPVHNMFLLALAELGVVGIVLLLLPTVVYVLRSLGMLRAKDDRANYARALILMSLAVVVVGLTSWGMLSGSMMYLWFFTLGYLARRAFTAPPQIELPETVETTARAVPGNRRPLPSAAATGR